MIRFLSFIKNPAYTETFEKIRWSDFFALLFLFYIIEIPLGAIINILIKNLALVPKPIALCYYQRVMYGLLLAPIVEELIMRLLLVFTKRNLVIFLANSIILSMVFLFRGSIIKFFFFISITFLFTIILVYHSSSRQFFIRYYKLFFYLIAILFGLIHISNFNGILMSNFMWTPLIVIPQIIMGLLSGYIRVTYGFIFAVLLHGLINFTVIFS